MALAQGIKNGGRYTRKQQEERRIQVYQLHFEQGQTAVKIAETLGVNRNTINDDIRFWNAQLADKIGRDNIVGKMNLQILKMELQRDRLLEYLDESNELDEKIRIERFISDIDNRLVQWFSKLVQSDTLQVSPDEISEDKIKDFVRDLILSDENPYSGDLWSEDKLEFEFIKRTQCDIPYALRVIQKMKRDGLVICFNRDPRTQYDPSDNSTKYAIDEFAKLRNYLTPAEFTEVREKRDKIKKEMEQEEEERKQEFIKKYGADKSKWSTDIRDKFEFGEYL